MTLKKKIKGAIFDFDGTLFDSMHIWATVSSDYIRSKGIEPEPDIDEKYKKFTLDEAVGYFRREYGLNVSPEEIKTGFYEVVEPKYFREVVPKPGIPELLRSMKEAGIPAAVATVTDAYLIEAALRRCGLLDLLTGVFSCQTLGLSKEDPRIFDTARASLGTERADTAVVEDSFFAATTAHAAGYIVVGVWDRFEKPTAELEKLADAYVKDTRELARVILNQI
ncbi:MAG: HAD family phosphatase [Clostridia bacterium]|nr:HAD family phosphatase [Clostridia bacterium]